MSFDVEHLERSVGNHLQSRHLGWCEQPYPLYAYDGEIGPTVTHLTIQKHLWLLWVENPLICGATEGTDFNEAIKQFLYLVSPDCVPFSSEGRKKWDDANPKIDFDLCKIGITEYMEAQFCNGTGYTYRPPEAQIKEQVEPEADDEGPSLREQVQAILEPLKDGHFAARYFRLLHREFGWDKETILHLPYPQLYMIEWEILFEAQQGRDGPKMYPKDSYMNAYLESMNK